MIEADADTGMRDHWINGIHHQGTAILWIILKEHLQTLWFKQMEARFLAEQKDDFQQSKSTISSGTQRRFLAEKKHDF